MIAIIIYIPLLLLKIKMLTKISSVIIPENYNVAKWELVLIQAQFLHQYTVTCGQAKLVY